MKKIVQISGNWSKYQVDVLQKYGLMTDVGCDTFFVEEETLDKNIFQLFKEWKVLVTRVVEFEKKEILDSAFCLIDQCREFGYPMPDDDFGYKELTYSITNEYCERCDIGKHQKDDFRIKNLPKAKFWSLGWVYDEFFVDKAIYEAVFRPFGVACRSVKNYKKETVIDSIVQLVIPDTDQPLDLSEYEYEICPVCGKIKYHAAVKGFFPIQENPTLHMYKSKEYFGSGGSSSKKVFVSAQLRDKMLESRLMNWRWFAPCVKRETASSSI
ncbi:MAG: hypothetical protein E7077_12150 [Bacteroidales bacterium]|jgi:hypothetical protein|nr:hypothetical protein [Bacteroidales bacterium]